MATPKIQEAPAHDLPAVAAAKRLKAPTPGSLAQPWRKSDTTLLGNGDHPPDLDSPTASSVLKCLAGPGTQPDAPRA